MTIQEQIIESEQRIDALKAAWEAESRKLIGLLFQEWKLGEIASKVMNTQAPLTPPLQVLPSATETGDKADLSDLGRVHVDWSGRGHSSGSYAVKADKGKYLEIVMELDVERVMTVAKTRTKAA